MNYENINLKTWKRRQHFLFFKELDLPFFNITGQIDVTKVKELAKSKAQSFTWTLLHIIITELNKIEEFRTRVIDNKPVIVDKIDVGSTIEAPLNTFLYSRFPFKKNLDEFIENANSAAKATLKENKLKPNKTIDIFYFTSIPWISYTHITHAKNIDKTDFIPRIAIGKYFSSSNEIHIPLSIEVNHAVCDGYHVGLLFQNIQKSINQIII